MRSRFALMSVAVAACLAITPAMAEEDEDSGGVAAKTVAKTQTVKPVKVASAKKLEPRKRASRLVAKINLSTQQMQIEVDGVVAHSWKISSGAAGHHTPTGTYKPYHLARMHYSRKYDNAPMPHSVFFRGGFAIHATGATRSLGRPASHGCIRLHPNNARTFYQLVQKYSKSGTQIRITGATPASSSRRNYAQNSSTPSRATSRKRSSGHSNWARYANYGNNYVSYRIGNRSRRQASDGRILNNSWW